MTDGINASDADKRSKSNLSRPLLPPKKEPSAITDGMNLVMLFQVVMIGVYAVVTQYDEGLNLPANSRCGLNGACLPSGETNTSSTSLGPVLAFSAFRNSYEMYKDICVMIFVGFGFLMAWLKKYGYGAVGFTMLCSVIAMELGILFVGMFNNIGTSSTDIPLSIDNFVQGLFAAAAVMISVGVVIGFVSPVQLVVLTVIEVPLYAANNYLVASKVHAVDNGGSIVIHLFGALYGLAAAYFLTPPKILGARDFANAASSYTSDLFSLVGTLFLWIYWPSFNSYTVAPEYQSRALANTILSLMSSSLAAFFVSWKLRGKFDVVDTQNATLAGGVAIGTVASMKINPGSAMVIGGLAGAIFVFTSCKLLFPLEDRLNIKDSVGVLALHCLPSVLGAFASVLFTGIATTESMVYQPFPEQKQWTAQLAGIGVTIALSVVGGAVTGFVLNKLEKPDRLYTDETSWDIPVASTIFTPDDEPAVKRQESKRNVLARRASVGVMPGVSYS